jgi:hypothetical protein
MIFNDYEELEQAYNDAREKWEVDDWDDEDEEYWDLDDWKNYSLKKPVICVTFNSNKQYHYYTKRKDLVKGDKLQVLCNGRETKVTVIGYSTKSYMTRRMLNIIKVFGTKPEKIKTGEKTMKITTKAVSASKEALTEAKDVALKYQEGSAVIVAIKTALYKSNLIPANIKKLIEAGNGVSDLVIGLTLQILAETFTDSEIISKAAKAANFTGAVSASSEFTTIQELIEKTVADAVGVVNTKTAKKECGAKEDKPKA